MTEDGSAGTSTSLGKKRVSTTSDPPRACACVTSTTRTYPRNLLLTQPAEVISKAQVLEASEGNANLVLDLSSSTSKPRRVTVRLNGEIALDVPRPRFSAVQPFPRLQPQVPAAR